MQVTETVNDGLKREYSITVDANVIGDKVQQRLLTLSKQIKMPGFRPGKVPLALVKKNYNESISSEVLEEVVSQTTKDVLTEKNLRPALHPEIKIISYKESTPLEYTLSLEIFPEIIIPDFSGLKLKKLKVEVADSDITEGLDRLADANKEYVRPEKPKKAVLENAVIIDFEGKIDGIAFEGGKAEGFRLVLGSGQFIEGFESQLVGTKEGETTLVKVTFPENYSSTNLAGKAAEFTVKVNEILLPVKPEIDDAFATKLGVESLDKLKELIKERIEKDFDDAAKSHLRRELFDVLDPLCTFPVPQGMVDSEFNTLWKQAMDEKEQNPDYYKDKKEDEVKDEYKKMSERRVRLGLLLAEIGKINDLTISQDEIRTAIYDQARQFPGQEHKVLEFYRKNPGSLEQLKGPILEDKAVDFILSKVNLKETSMTVKKMQALIEEENQEA